MLFLIFAMPALLMAIPFVLAWTEDQVVRPEEYGSQIKNILMERDPEQIEKEVSSLLEPVHRIVWP